MTTTGVALGRPTLARIRVAGVALLALLFLAGCGYREPAGVRPPFEHWEHLTDLPVPKEPLAPRLKILIWRDYLDPRILAAFEKRYQTTIEITYFENNAELKQIFNERPNEFDLLMPSDYVVERLIKEKRLAPIRKENVPNMGHIKQVLFRSPYDPELVYSVPMFHSCLGITFNFRKLQHIPRDFTLRAGNDAEDLLLSGYRALIDEPRVALSAALMDDGVDPNAPTPEALAKTADRLIRDATELGINFVASALPERMINDEIVLAVNWSGAAAVAAQKNPAIRFVLPQGKKFVQVDSFVIPLTSQRQYTAEFFLDFLLIPEISGALTNYSLYANSNGDSTPFISREILLGPAYMDPPHNQRIFFADLGPVEEDFERQWTRVKQAAPPPKIKVPSLLRKTVEQQLKSDIAH
ncbi:MAG TPA: spermidine/putrescine ABC transporter substrate-binding protein [Opitutus sp.]|nr:spermidine/putrescine ABC transporter substrate-binding protein [Opitutus sp.]